MPQQLASILSAAYRLGMLYTRLASYDAIYGTALDPEIDEHILLELVEGARNVWRPIRRCRCQR